MDFKATLKRVEPFFAIGVFVILLFTATLLFNEQKLKKEISENCGWGEEDYRCYCRQTEVGQIEDILNWDLNSSDVALVE